MKDLEKYICKLDDKEKTLDKYSGNTKYDKIISLISSVNHNEVLSSLKILIELNKLFDNKMWFLKFNDKNKDYCSIVYNSEEYGLCVIIEEIEIEYAFFIVEIKNSMNDIVKLLNFVYQVKNDPNYTFRYAEGMESCYEIINKIIETGKIDIRPNNKEMSKCFNNLSKILKKREN